MWAYRGLMQVETTWQRKSEKGHGGRFLTRRLRSSFRTGCSRLFCRPLLVKSQHNASPQTAALKEAMRLGCPLHRQLQCDSRNKHARLGKFHHFTDLVCTVKVIRHEYSLAANPFVIARRFHAARVDETSTVSYERHGQFIETRSVN